MQPNNFNNFYVGFDYKIDQELLIGVNFNRNQTTYVSFAGATDIFDYGAEFQTNFDWAKRFGMNTRRWDLYSGFNFGYLRLKYVTGNSQTFNNRWDLKPGGQAGVRYFITRNIGINFELNSGNLAQIPVRAGLSVKF